MANESQTAAVHAARQRIRRLATWLDSGIAIPGTHVRIGVEALIGLLPIAGDAVGLLLGLWLLYEAVRLRAPASLFVRMLGNVALDAVVGAVPVIGDAFDFAFKSNRRNARLLDAHLARLLDPPPPPPRWRGALRAALALALLALAAWGAGWLWRTWGTG
ncbi:protein of unknown function [Fontimonas thermophila]|uniref:DUF4112 domain-containing protein n=1 Tax=Fontimonas thermophila TaxID=1076937 RepID=A0A1I2JPY4_9GAMM|nr:DUF4112 domain-containing protein [Fontimonas thermophila]SFF56872.1 protein of unknown function [Fontimonas thermophila]